jgi:hypothetical protein
MCERRNAFIICKSIRATYSRVARLGESSKQTRRGERRDMAAEIAPPVSSLNNYEGVERRLKPRVEGPFFARLRGVDAGGAAFQENVFIINMSPTGIYLRTLRQVEPGANVFLVFRLPASLTESDSGALIAVRGIVLRTDAESDGSFGSALTITSHRFLTSASGFPA